MLQPRRSGYLRHGLLYGVPTLAVFFFLLHSRLIALLEQDFQHRQDISGIHQLYYYDGSQYESKLGSNGNNLGVCHRLLNGQEHNTASSIWLNSKQKLFSAFLSPVWMEELWKFLAPFNLQQSTFPQVNPILLQRILDKLQVRLSYLQDVSATKDETTTEPPKIQVLVFGGSVAEGVGCDAPPPLYLTDDMSQFKVSSLQECSWPYRLQQLADAVFPNAIEIHNLAVGGTHSRAAVPILEHGLYPPHVHVNENNHYQHDDVDDGHPDIILNAYAANDNLPPAFYNTENTTHDNFHKYRVLKRLLEFVQAASDADDDCNHSNHQPWIVFVNDYMGNQQESLVGESTVDELVQLLMQMLSAVSYVSPARMLEPYIWANTTEHVWSGVWKKKKKKKKLEATNEDDYKVDVHYGMAGHLTTAMVVAHAFFQWTMEYCQDQVLFGNDDDDDQCSSSWMPSSSRTKGLQDTRIPIHELTSGLQIDLPSKEWMKTNQPDRVYPNITEGRNVKVVDIDSSACGRPKQQCAFAFLAAPLGTHSKKGPLQEYIQSFTVGDEDDGWQVQNNFRHGGFQNKLGLVATRPGARLELKVPASKGYRKLTIHYLKSYGPDWENSRVRGTIQVQETNKRVLLEEQTFELEGFHDQQVSISYTHVVMPKILVYDGDATTSTIISLKLELIGGSNFKINAMMLC